MSLKDKLETRAKEVNQLAQEARDNDHLKSATTFKKKAIYFKKVLTDIIEKENKHSKKSKLADISKVKSDPVYKNANKQYKR